VRKPQKRNEMRFALVHKSAQVIENKGAKNALPCTILRKVFVGYGARSAEKMQPFQARGGAFGLSSCRAVRDSRPTLRRKSIRKKSQESNDKIAENWEFCNFAADDSNGLAM
jgi:hypothetical protein